MGDVSANMEESKESGIFTFGQTMYRIIISYDVSFNHDGRGSNQKDVCTANCGNRTDARTTQHVFGNSTWRYFCLSRQNRRPNKYTFSV
jgi:hypothetical protein